MTNKFRMLLILVLAGVFLFVLPIVSFAEETVEGEIVQDVTDEDGYVIFEDDDDWGYIDQEVIDRNIPDVMPEQQVITEAPTAEPTPEPTPEPTSEPTSEPTPEPTAEPTPAPAAEPAAAPTEAPGQEEKAEAKAEEVPEEAQAESTDDAEKAGRLWITCEQDGSLYYGDTIHLKANAENIELTDDIRWETADEQDEQHKDEWSKAGTGRRIELKLNEENTALTYRFVLPDGTVSETYHIKASEKNAEQEETVQPAEGEVTDTEPAQGEDTEKAEAADEPVAEDPEEVKEEEAEVKDGGDEEEAAPETAETEVPAEDALPEAEAEPLAVKVLNSLDGVESVSEGTEMILTAVVDGDLEKDYTYQWQVSADGGETYTDIEGETDQQLTVILTQDNAGFLWRVRVREAG